MKKYGIAFAGFRHNHIFSLFDKAAESERFEIKGAFEENEEARRAAEEKGVTFNCNTFSELLECGAEIIAIGDYYAARGRIAIEVLKAGKHVICDKPLCTDIGELKEIRKLAADGNLCVGMMLDMRQNRNAYKTLSIIKSGEIGKVCNIVFEGQHPLLYGSRAGWYFEKDKHGGTINDIAVHGIDLVRHFTDSNISQVVCATERNCYAVAVPDFRDSAQFIVKTDSGAVITADVSYAAPSSHGYSHPSYWRFSVWGEKGMLTFNGVNDGIDLYVDGKDYVRVIPEEVKENYLDEFVDALDNPVQSSAYTTDIIDTAEQTLMIQSAASGAEK